MAMATTGELRIEHVAIDSLRPDPANPRRIGERELESLTRSLQQFGFVQPVLARRSDKVVIGGHQRLVAARRLGWKTVPVVFLDLSPEQAKLLNLALNKISGQWDTELLAHMLADLKPVEDIDLSLSGFTEDEIGKLLKSLEARDKRSRVESFDLEAAWEEAHKAPGVTRGDIWRLGGTTASCAATPPTAGPCRASRTGRRRTIANDALPPEQWEAFCRRWAEQLLAHVDGALYICMSTREWPVVTRVLEELGGHWSDTIIWAKDRFVLGRADYQRQYEPIWYGWREGASHHWCGDRDQGDVWTIPRPAESELHPTMKPLALVERAVENSSRTGDLVLDLFLGSGTSVIAAERTGRICYGMKLDPHYCRIVIARWEAFSGLKAERLPEWGR
jgi:hypothetical protein